MIHIQCTIPDIFCPHKPLNYKHSDNKHLIFIYKMYCKSFDVQVNHGIDQKVIIALINWICLLKIWTKLPDCLGNIQMAFELGAFSKKYFQVLEEYNVHCSTYKNNLTANLYS